jgi:serine protease inhibitor
MPRPFAHKPSGMLSTEASGASSSPSTRFAFRLFQQLAGADDANIFFSPSGVMLCLAMVRDLASGETRWAMERGLEIADLNSADTELAIATLNQAFRPRPDLTIMAPNSLWCSVDARVRPELSARLRDFYDAEMTSVDFADPEAVRRINAWVSNKTNSRVDSILDSISPLAALVAVNAVYFKGSWIDRFQRSNTTYAQFTTATGQKKTLPLMLQEGKYKYYEDRSMQAIALPYHGGASMYVLLPAEGIGQKFLPGVTSGLLDSCLARLELRPGTIALPRFKLDYCAQLEAALKVLGMEHAFDPRRAEFGGIQTDRTPVWIDQVLHRAVAEVNEEGTEAAATPAVAMLAFSGMRPRPEPRTFNMIVNRPFLVALRDEETGTILFLGWISDPQ